MEQNDKIKKTDNCKYAPLFTGKYTHDTSISEYEKIAEASNAISNVIMEKIKKKKGKQNKG